MSNTVLKPESTGNNYKKAEKLWNYWSYDTGAFPKMNNTEKNDIEGASGTQLARSITIFNTWMLSKPKPGLYGKNYHWSPKVILKTIGKIFVILERKKQLLPIRYQRIRSMTLEWRIKKMVEIRGWALIFSRSEGHKSVKGYLHRTKKKEIVIIYLREVGGIGSKSMLQIL